MAIKCVTRIYHSVSRNEMYYFNGEVSCFEMKNLLKCTKQSGINLHFIRRLEAKILTIWFPWMGSGKSIQFFYLGSNVVVYLQIKKTILLASFTYNKKNQEGKNWEGQCSI